MEGIGIHRITQALKTKYTLERSLRERETACVRLLRDQETGQRVVFRRYQGDGAVYRKLMAVDCPNLPHVLAVEEENGQTLVLEEYIQGDSLEELLKGCPMTPKEAVQIAVQLCGALEVLHGLGAVHRDIKPSNIILRGDQAVLIDFDAARIHKQTQSGDTQVMGTTGYAAPEQYGFAQTDARTDIYAMGVLLNVMVTGQHPSKVLVEGRLRKIVETCIQVHADRRYPTAKALAEALTAKKRRVWPWAAVLAAVLLAGSLWLGLGRPGEPEVSTPQEPVAPAEPAAAKAPEEEQSPMQETAAVQEPLQLSVDPSQPMGGIRQFDLLLNGQIATAEDVESISLSDSRLGSITSAEAEIAAGSQNLNLEQGHWRWHTSTAYPEVEGQMLVTIDGKDYALDVSTRAAAYRFYTEDVAFIAEQVDQQILYEPGNPGIVDFEILDSAVGPITAVRCENNDNVTWELDEAEQKVRFLLHTETPKPQSANLVVETNGGIYWFVAEVLFVPNTLAANVSLKNCRMPGTMQFDLLLDGEVVAAERVEQITLSDPALGEIQSIPALMEEGDWAHGTEWGQWLWVVESARPNTAGLLTAVIDGVAYYTEVSTGAPDCGYYTDPNFSDEHYLPFGVMKLFEYEPGQDMTVWFTAFDGETILRAYTDHEEFLVDLPQEPTGTVAFRLNPELSGDHSFRFTVVTNTGIYRILRASLLEKQ